MTLPIAASNRVSTSKISLEDGDEWIGNHGHTLKIMSCEGPEVFVKITVNGEIMARKFYKRPSVHRWIKDKEAVKVTL